MCGCESDEIARFAFEPLTPLRGRGELVRQHVDGHGAASRVSRAG
jgi:hypothetical protein